MFDNVYIYDLKEKVKAFSSNRYLAKVTAEFEKIDSINDYESFKKAVLEYKHFVGKRNRVFSYAQYGGEGLNYGHRQAFFEYAGFNEYGGNYLLPYFEHGINWQEQYLQTYSQPLLHSFVFQGPYKNKMMHLKRPKCPIYNIGPYVLYAKSYYSTEQTENKRQENGKTLLLYPLHTCEGATADFDRDDFVRRIMNTFKNQYNTIMISVYWNDVDDPLYDAFKAEGAKLVSAGYRGDPNFIRRLRTIIELSDMTAGNHIGTHIGYCMALRKPHVIFDVNAKANEAFRKLSVEEEYIYQTTLKQFYQAFSDIHPDKENIKLQQALYEKFWGGISCMKSVEEAQEIIKVSKKILHLSHGSVPKIMSIMNSVIDKKNVYSEFEEYERELLRKATSCNE